MLRKVTRRAPYTSVSGGNGTARRAALIAEEHNIHYERIGIMNRVVFRRKWNTSSLVYVRSNRNGKTAKADTRGNTQFQDEQRQ